MHKASTSLDHAKFKAEKKLRKALSKVGKGKDRSERRRACSKRRWTKIRNFVKSVFGVSPAVEHTHHHHHHHAEEVVASPVEKGELAAEYPYDEAVIESERSHEKRDEERRSPLKGVRLGKAAAGWAADRKRAALRQHERREAAVEESESKPADRRRGLRQSKPCKHHTNDKHSISNVWSLSSDEDAVPNRGPLRKVFKAAQAVRRVNAKLAAFEGGFISEAGIKDREWYRHLGVAPGKWLGYGATTFPALTEALDERNSTLATAEAERLAELVTELAHFLKL